MRNLLAVGMLAAATEAYNLAGSNMHTTTLAQRTERKIRYHDHKHDKHDDTCGYQCIESKTDAGLEIMLTKIEDQNNETIAEASGLRNQVLGEIQALRAQLAASAQAEVDSSITSLNALLDSSLEMLAGTLGDVKSTIDAEK